MIGTVRKAQARRPRFPTHLFLHRLLLMTSLLQQAIENEASGSGGRRAQAENNDEEDILIPLARLPEESWRRLVLRAFLLLQSARLQFVASELIALPDRRIRLKEPSPTGGLVSKAEVFARGFLSDSTTLRGKTHMSKTNCPHEVLLPRGGRSFWFACRDCPARWPRKSQEERIDTSI